MRNRALTLRSKLFYLLAILISIYINQVTANTIGKNPPASTSVFKNFTSYMKYKEIKKKKSKIPTCF